MYMCVYICMCVSVKKNIYIYVTIYVCICATAGQMSLSCIADKFSYVHLDGFPFSLLSSISPAPAVLSVCHITK